ncbi:MAG: hypothetical protein IT293_01180 [Deltaproteobacteria bacterium]|nr:hypothetical protein [Deltaproteobacteria bacterium]
MTLADYYFADPRVFLIPIEHLGPAGMSAELAAGLRSRGAWSREQGALFDRSFQLYWKRSADLARRTRTWMPPRIRHVAVVLREDGVRPYAQILNTSAWTVYACDFDPRVSHPELGAYVLAHGDRMALAGEATLAALHNAVWWLERSDEECAAFAAAAARSRRPDADGLRAVARALPWLRRLRHETLAPPVPGAPHRAIPGTGILVPRALEGEPRSLVDAWSAAARRALDGYRAAWRADPARVIAELGDWLARDAPPLLVTGGNGRIVWDPAHPERIGALREALERGDAAGVAAVRDDLRLVARHTRAFHAALVDPAALPPPAAEMEQRGYSYLHRERGLIAYDLDEPGMERLSGPDLPYARAMLGARTVHEWAHLAVDAGWVPCVAGERAFAARRGVLAEAFTRVVAAMSPALRALTAVDLSDLSIGGLTPGEALVRLFLTRIADWQANVLAQRFLDRTEIETYVRHNIRTLRFVHPPAELLRMLVRYLFELQYLRFSEVADARAFLVRSTWFASDCFATGLVDADMFAELDERAAALCACWAVDEARFTARR